ncbi:BfmA/BtgA family mobilization protein [Larkinella insperata]|uniref:BfmA/BtgA family mobilization protein n=1 Tax=Larkinella insperata TaxID=332158 RepID=A0ABW3QBY1_9BACT
MEAKASKSVRFNLDTDLKFSKLSEKLGRSKQELFGQMVDYFYKSKKDPGDLNDELLKKELGQGINRIIAFIKTQEKEALTPLMVEQRELQRSLAGFREQFEGLFSFDEQHYVHGYYLKTQQERQKENKTLLEKQEEFEEQQENMAAMLENLLAETRSYQKAQKAQREEKDALKGRFRALLETYIQQREALNALTQGRAVKDLQEHLRSQVDQL